jgi:hypothetical protein
MMQAMTRGNESSAATGYLLVAFELSQRWWKVGFTTGMGHRVRMRQDRRRPTFVHRRRRDRYRKAWRMTCSSARGRRPPCQLAVDDDRRQAPLTEFLGWLVVARGD